MFKNERTKYLNAMRKADRDDYGPMGELIARAVTNNLYRFVVPAVAGPSRFVPLASLADEKAGITVTALRAAAERGRLRAQKSDSGIWLSSREVARRIYAEQAQAHQQGQAGGHLEGDLDG